jgi:ankyrin repeat protein
LIHPFQFYQTSTRNGMFFGSKKTESSEEKEMPSAAPKKVDPHYLDDEPEVDYDVGPTQLYKFIEGKQWDKAINRIESHPHEAKTWVFRREPANPKKVRWRLLPVHATCIFRSPLAVIEALVSCYPDGVQMKDDQDMLPLHLACRNGASKGVVLTLLYAFPEAMAVTDRKKRTPAELVEMSASQNREAVIIALKRFAEDGVEVGGKAKSGKPEVNEVDYDNRTILFRLILKKDWNGACQRCEAFPEEASTWINTKGFHGNLRFLPLHKVCVLSPPMGMVEALISAYPDGAKCKDQDGWLPIHCACFYGASQTIINELIKTYPNCASNKDDEGRTPLHYASLKCASENVVTTLLRANPKAAVSKDDEGRLPIHHACSKGAPDGSIEALLKVSAKGAQSKDDQGRLPLHHACRKNASVQVVKMLLTIYMKAANVKDDQDKLPIHYACQNGAETEIIELLMNSNPESLNSKNG